jgi:hypothetical protein
MKTFFFDIFPKIQRFSEKLDNITLLTNQHWVCIDNILNNKTVYIFRSNNDLLISTNGIVEKAKWEYLGNKSLLIDIKENSYLFKHGFFDQNILALKVDSKEEYALFVNENKYEGELNNVNRITDFLKTNYLDAKIRTEIHGDTGQKLLTKAKQHNVKYATFHTNRGIVEIEHCNDFIGQYVYLNGQLASDGLYKFTSYFPMVVKDGKIAKIIQ